jgi:hypothetical protein
VLAQDSSLDKTVDQIADSISSRKTFASPILQVFYINDVLELNKPQGHTLLRAYDGSKNIKNQDKKIALEYNYINRVLHGWQLEVYDSLFSDNKRLLYRKPLPYEQVQQK